MTYNLLVPFLLVALTTSCVNKVDNRVDNNVDNSTNGPIYLYEEVEDGEVYYSERFDAPSDSEAFVLGYEKSRRYKEQNWSGTVRFNLLEYKLTKNGEDITNIEFATKESKVRAVDSIFYTGSWYLRPDSVVWNSAKPLVFLKGEPMGNYKDRSWEIVRVFADKIMRFRRDDDANWYAICDKVYFVAKKGNKVIVKANPTIDKKGFLYLNREQNDALIHALQKSDITIEIETDINTVQFVLKSEGLINALYRCFDHSE